MSDERLRILERKVAAQPDNEDLLRQLRCERCKVGLCCGHAIQRRFTVVYTDVVEFNEFPAYARCFIELLCDSREDFYDFVRTIDEAYSKRLTYQSRTTDRVSGVTTETHTTADPSSLTPQYAQAAQHI